MSTSAWLVGTAAWLIAVAAARWLLAAAPRANAAARAQAAPAPLPDATLDHVLQELRADVGVDQVLLVVCDETSPGHAVVLAGAGVSAAVVGHSLAARDSIAAAVAHSGRDAIMAGHGPLDRPRRPNAVGDAGAVALATPPGAIAIARLAATPALTPADLDRLRDRLRPPPHRAAPRTRTARPQTSGRRGSSTATAR